MKNHLGFSSLCLLLAVLLLSGSLQAAFKIDVHINDAPNPTLTFGEVVNSADTRSLPHPPFSGMFGVVDVCFAGPEGAEQWYDRLAEDIKAVGTNTINQWILVAKSNARITWNLKDGIIPLNLKIAWIDIKTGTPKFEEIEDGESLNLKTGVAYTIKEIADEETFVPEENPDKSTGYAKKDEDGNIQPVEFKFDPPEDQPETLEIRLHLNAGTGAVRHEKEKEQDKPDALWEVIFNAPGYDVDYDWDEDNPNILIITLTKNPETRDGQNGDWGISVAAQKTSAPPLEISETSEVLGLIDKLYAIMLRFGTLDFDGDGKITYNDVMFLYNYVKNECPTDENNRPIFLIQYTNFTDQEKALDAAKKAYQFFIDNLSDLNFDNEGDQEKPEYDDSIYLYNFSRTGFSDDANPRLMTQYTKSGTKEIAEFALERLREYMDGLEIEQQ